MEREHRRTYVNLPLVLAVFAVFVESRKYVNSQYTDFGVLWLSWFWPRLLHLNQGEEFFNNGIFPSLAWRTWLARTEPVLHPITHRHT